MFHRIIVEDWQRVLSIVSITLFLLVFVINLVRVRRMPRQAVVRLENLPLEKDEV